MNNVKFFFSELHQERTRQCEDITVLSSHQYFDNVKMLQGDRKDIRLVKNLLLLCPKVLFKGQTAVLPERSLAEQLLKVAILISFQEKQYLAFVS